MSDGWPDIPRNADGKLVSITSVAVIAPGILRLEWDDGVQRDVGVSDASAKQNPLLQELAKPEHFATARRGEFGGVEWKNGVDMCPHALRLKADEQHTARMAAAE